MSRRQSRKSLRSAANSLGKATSKNRSRISSASAGALADRVVVDSIHGVIHPSRDEWRVVDTATFQRLRHLKQLGLGQVTYPNATHTRFAHSLGVLEIMRRVLEVAGSKLNLGQGEIEELRLAALLHDIGHYPYSHLMESIDNAKLTEDFVGSAGKKSGRILHLAKESSYPKHEQLGELIVTSQRDMIEAIGGDERASRVAALFTRSKAADDQLSKLIHSSLDMDRLDYLVRDARAAGVPYGEVNLNYLLRNIRASPNGMIGIDYKAISAAEQYLLARFFMHKTVYYHKTTFALEEVLRQLLRRCRDKKMYGVPRDGGKIREIVTDSSRLLSFTDSFVDRIAYQAIDDRDPVIKALAHAVVFRRPQVCLKKSPA